MPLTTLRLNLPGTLDEPAVAALCGALGDLSHASTHARADRKDDSPWVLTWYCEELPRMDEVLSRLSVGAILNGINPAHITRESLEHSVLADRNWLEESYRGFPALTIGPFFIHGSHIHETPPPGSLALQIDAATAFGTGEHETTRGCLEAIIALKDLGVCPWNILDMGTGSGILALAAWRLWQSPVLAVDNDPEAVRMTDLHRVQNGILAGPGALEALVGEGFSCLRVRERAPYDLILANILAGPLRDMAPDLCAVLDEGGTAILSGLLETQSEDVKKAYEAQGLSLKNKYVRGDWATLVLGRSIPR